MVGGTSSGSPVDSGMELEPNNKPSNANTLSNSLEISGVFGKRQSQFQGDKDAYKIAMRGAGKRLSLQVSALKGVDVSVDVLESDYRLITRVNNAGIGQMESLQNILVKTEEAIIVVSEHNESKSEPSEDTDPYVLKATVSGPPDGTSEVEPNDTAGSASPYTPGKRLSAALDGPET